MTDSNVSNRVMASLAIVLAVVAIGVSIAANKKYDNAIEKIKAECAAKDSVAVKDIDGQYVCLPKE